MMQATLPLTLGTLALAACAPAVGPGAVDTAAGARLAQVAGYDAVRAGKALQIRRSAGQPFGYSDGAEARRAADRFCGGRVDSSTYDNFQAGAWIFPQGCA